MSDNYNNRCLQSDPAYLEGTAIKGGCVVTVRAKPLGFTNCQNLIFKWKMSPFSSILFVCVFVCMRVCVCFVCVCVLVLEVNKCSLNPLTAFIYEEGA